MSSKRPCRIIVVGGGVAGLTLANMFEKFGIDYVLLEAYDEIVAPSGAAIGLMPNGSAIMDQLGCFEAIELAAQDGELEDSHIRDSDGKSLMGLKHMMYHQEKRHGYAMLFFNRQWFLKVLYDQLKNKDRIQLKSRVENIKSIKGGVQVTTHDGRSFGGDFVLGGDGIHSNVRREMRRIAEITNPKYFERGEEETVPCYYQCSYGIAQHVDGWPGREQCFTAGRGKSFLVVSGPAGRCYWFLFIKLPEVKYGAEIPRYSKEDEARFVREHASLKIKENLTFGQVYAKRLTSALTPLHEIVYKKWFFGRIFLVGDSAHKPNPIGGMGANAAIETSAEMLNALLDAKAQRGNTLDNLTTKEIESIFQRVQDARHTRANYIVSASHELQALLAHENPFLSRLALKVLMPLSGPHNFFRDLSLRIVGGSRLKHIALPTRPRAIPYDHELPAKPIGVKPSRIAWGLFSLGMILLMYTAKNTRISNHELGGLSFPGMDSSLPTRLRLIYSLTNMLSVALIYTGEGYRVGRQGSILSLPIIFMIAIQLQGLYKTAPIYAFLSACQSDQNTVDRAVRIHVAKSLVAALVLSFMIPTILIISGWQDWIQLETVPLVFSILTAIFSFALDRLYKSKNEAEADKHEEWYETADAKILMSAYHFVVAAQILVHIASIVHVSSNSNLSVIQALWGLSNPIDPIAIHNLYSVWELRRQGYVSTSEAVNVASAVVTGQVLVGSGATWAALWSWRESVVLELGGGKSLK